ncbi:SDR family oxidoreductase [Alisedimentitalea sp. MJ-SS2]|uniref:SDR family oxidoreductase n=1 Tax=Aliisedimentitalea sp. MJ-SS2 TaxID=3049795 RepID=UPI0029152155|nr:SDR family oxidoreductase [Alisedimentitalea sp. MJ-SS2]MDU8928973.1 SDR family oxidoreductase [Alisedimentitalea sp. MJ-SS2]
MPHNTLLITGGSNGIGAACARLGAAQGRDVILTYHSDEAAARAVATDIEAAGQTAQVVQCDVAEPTSIEALFAGINPATPIDLINNAGIVAPTASINDLDAERLTRIFAINVVGAILVAKHAVAHMRAAPAKGHIVNISSAAARLGSANLYIDYAASKGAIDTFTKGLADELAPEGIRVNAIRPGLILTDIHTKGGEPDRAKRLGGTVPIGRPGSAEEVAEAVLWLLSDAASYVTGAHLDVSGGR